MRRTNRRAPVERWRDPSTGEELDVYIPAAPYREGEEEERRLLDEAKRKREADPEYQLKKFQEQKAREEEERRRRASPDFRAQEVTPRRERLREIEEDTLRIVMSVFGRLGALHEPGNVDTSCGLDDLRVKFEALSAEWASVNAELVRAQGGTVPYPPPSIPPRVVAIDCSVQALQWLNYLAMQGWHAYSGKRKLPPIYVAPGRSRR